MVSIEAGAVQDELWPDIDSDPMFLWVSLLAWEAAEKYFEEVRANTPWDLWVGLVDRGYFRDPDDERELQREWKRFRELHEILPGLGREYAR